LRETLDETIIEFCLLIQKLCSFYGTMDGMNENSRIFQSWLVYRNDQK